MTHYEVLGIEKDATQEQIKAAYRTLAKKYHPDVNDAANANAFFRLIQEAYETLNDPQKKREYDYGGSSPEPKVVEGNAYHDSYDSVNDNNTYANNYQQYHIYEEQPAQKRVFWKFPVADSIITIIFVTPLLCYLAHIHVAISIVIGIAISAILAALFRTKVGWWIIAVIYSAVWAVLIGGLIYSFTHDNIWLWCTIGVSFLVSLAAHRNLESE